MGVDTAYFRNDDCLGVAIANFANEMTALYVCDGSNLLFTDDAIPTGLGPPTRLDLSFGLLFVDVDLDGRLDLVAANGHLENDINQVQSSQHYRQPTRLFWNAGARICLRVHRRPAGQTRTRFRSARGRPRSRRRRHRSRRRPGPADHPGRRLPAAAAKRPDNEITTSCDSNSSVAAAIGTRSEPGSKCSAGDPVLRRQVMPTGSYLSQSELPVTIGLGTIQAPDRVRVRWPDGTEQEVLDYRLNSTTLVTQRP